MAEYDAFGREIGEDPLEALRAPDAEPVEQARPEQPPRRRRRRPGFTFVFVIVMAVVAIQAFATTGDDGGPSVAVKTPEATADRPALDEAPVRDDRRARSLLAPRAFGAAIDKLREARLGRLATLRVEASRLDAQLRVAGDRMRIVQVSPSLEVRTIAITPGGAGLRTFPFDAVRREAPRRLVRASARGRRVNYVVMMVFGDVPKWFAYFHTGGHAVGDSRGRLERSF